jgi:hypothetical protein
MNNKGNMDDEEETSTTTRRPTTSGTTSDITTGATPVPMSSIDENKYYYICNKWNKCLASRANSVENNQEVIQWAKFNEKGQKWQLKKSGTLCNQNNMCIYSSDNSEFDGSIVRQIGSTDVQDGGKWEIKPEGNICNKFEKCIVPRANAGTDGEVIIQWSPSQENGQLWSFYNA